MPRQAKIWWNKQRQAWCTELGGRRTLAKGRQNRKLAANQLKALLQEPSGIFVVSAPPGHGLSSLLTATCYSFDRFMRSAAAVEEASRKELDVENIGVTLYDASKGDSPVATLTTVARQYPDVIVVRDVAELDTLSMLIDQVGQNRLTITSTRAKEAVDIPIIGSLNGHSIGGWIAYAQKIEEAGADDLSWGDRHGG